LKNIYVGNISFQTTEQDLDAAFSAYGQVDRVQIVKDRDTGQARGFAFVEMPVNADADKAMAALNGATIWPTIELFEPVHWYVLPVSAQASWIP